LLCFVSSDAAFTQDYLILTLEDGTLSARVITSARLLPRSDKATPEPKDLAEKFAAKIAAKKVEEERLKKE